MVTRYVEKMELKELRDRVSKLESELATLKAEKSQLVATRDSLMAQLAAFREVGVNFAWGNRVKLNYRKLTRSIGHMGRKELGRRLRRSA